MAIEFRKDYSYRHQFNIADSGSGSRGPRVQNDRAGEVGRTLNVKDFDLEGENRGLPFVTVLSM